VPFLERDVNRSLIRVSDSRLYFSFGISPFSLFFDIHRRKQTEEALRKRDAELAEAQRLARVGSWQWDPNTDTVQWSKELYRIAGRDPEFARSWLQGTLVIIYDGELGTVGVCGRRGGA